MSRQHIVQVSAPDGSILNNFPLSTEFSIFNQAIEVIIKILG